MDVPRRRGPTLSTWILIGLVLGAITGLLLNVALAPAPGAAPEPGWIRLGWWADEVARPIGDVFLRLLFMVVVPLVFCSLVVGVAGLGAQRELSRVGGRTLAWFFATSALAAVFGVALAGIVRPGAGLSPETVQLVAGQFAGAAEEKVSMGQAGPGFSLRMFVEIIPRNVVASAADNRQALGVILFALLVGLAVGAMPRARTATLLEVLEALYEVCTRILSFAMLLAPVGVFGLVFAVTATLGLDVLAALMGYVVTAIAGLVAFQFVVLPLLAWWFAGVSPPVFLRGTRALVITAFSTSSSNATLPTTIRTAEQVFGVPRAIAGFVLPLGATMNMNGTAVFLPITVVFLAQVAGVELSVGQLAIVVALAVITAVGSAGVPGGSLPLITIVLSQVGVPPELIALIIGTDRIVDMTRTVPNITGDLVCSLWLARSERGRLTR